MKLKLKMKLVAFLFTALVVGVSGLLSAIDPVSQYLLKVTISADDNYILYIPGRLPITGPNNFSIVRTYFTALPSKGPWVVGIKGVGGANMNGLFAGVVINGRAFTSTGISTTRFQATTVPQTTEDWLGYKYNASTWQTREVLSPAGCNTTFWLGNGFYKSLNEQMPNQQIKASWLPSCTTRNNQVYFRTVVSLSGASSSIQCDAAFDDRNKLWTNYWNCKQTNLNYLETSSNCPSKYILYSIAYDNWESGCAPAISKFGEGAGTGSQKFLP